MIGMIGDSHGRREFAALCCTEGVDAPHAVLLRMHKPSVYLLCAIVRIVLCEENIKCTGNCLGNLPCGKWCPDLRRVLGEMLPPVISCFQPDIVLYDAGVDPHKDDSLGKLALTDEGLLRRELQVSQPRSLAGCVPCLVLNTRFQHFYITSCLSVFWSSLGFPLVPGRC